MLFSLAAFAQSNIYNPDSDDDGLITSEDLLIFLSNFGNDFTPNPCNCGCYANPFYEPYAIQDTITAFEVASNLFYSVPDSIQLDFVIAPYGVGSLPFMDVDTLYYDTLTFQQTYPFRHLQPGTASNSGDQFGDYVAYMLFRTNSNSGYYDVPVTDGYIEGGLDVIDSNHPNFNGGSQQYPLQVEADNVCPNLLNDEWWRIHEETMFFQVENGKYVNVMENPAMNLPSNASEFPTWSFWYPLVWLVITEIHNDPAE